MHAGPAFWAGCWRSQVRVLLIRMVWPSPLTESAPPWRERQGACSSNLLPPPPVSTGRYHEQVGSMSSLTCSWEFAFCPGVSIPHVLQVCVCVLRACVMCVHLRPLSGCSGIWLWQGHPKGPPGCLSAALRVESAGIRCERSWKAERPQSRTRFHQLRIFRGVLITH